MRIHIRNQQVNRKKSVTTIEGFDDDIDAKKLCKAMKRRFACNGSVRRVENDIQVIVLQGDQRYKAVDFLNMIEIAEDIIVHGY